MSTLRDQIKARREAIGMTQAQLAALAGFAQPKISGYERGLKDLNGATLDRIIEALGRAELRWLEEHSS